MERNTTYRDKAISIAMKHLGLKYVSEAKEIIEMIEFEHRPSALLALNAPDTASWDDLVV